MSFSTSIKKRRTRALLSAICVIAAGTSIAQQKADQRTLSTQYNKVDHTPNFIQFTANAGWKSGQEQELFHQYLGIDGLNMQMVQQYRTTTKANVTTSRYCEYYKGIKVAYGSYTVTEKNGLIQFISGNYYNAPTGTATTPAITEQDALNHALALVGATKYMWEDPSAEENLKATYKKPDTTYRPKGELVWIEHFRAEQKDRKLHLAYAFNIYAQAPMSRQMVYVDASNGNILYTENLIKHTAASNKTLFSGVVPFVTSHITGTYTLYDSTRGGGVYTRSVNHNTSVTGITQINSTTNNWPVLSADTQALDVHWGVEKVYDYWFTQQSRDSWDGAGGILLSYIHMNDAMGGGNMDNAYWNGSEMCYGDGTGLASGGFLPLVSLDVTAHELGHGICQATAGLAYQYESGAINEGLSDCWGATVEHWADPHETDAVAKNYWKIGEEIGGGTPLRSMDYPHNEQNPDTYGTNDPYWYDIVGCTPSNATDECGVHTNSGVTNKWYYLVVMGGTGVNANGDSYAVNGIGWTEAPQILYQTELALSSTATYDEFRTTSIAVATTLYGPCSAEVQSITNAWYAVGVGAAFVPCFPQIGYTVTNLTTTERVASTACPASRTVSIGVKPTGTLISGGNPVVTVIPAYGTAVAGQDYSLSGTVMTFLAGDTSTHYATLTIYDNGAINDDKTLVLGLSIADMGTGTTISPLGDTMRITISNNDSGVQNGGPEYHTLNIGTAVTCNLTSAFTGTNSRSRTQWILSADEMRAAGVRPGAPINQIGFYLTSKSSTAAFQNYSISMANTTATDVSTAFVGTGLVNVFPAAAHTTNLGLDTLNFTTTFTWDGTSNVAVQVCYGMNTWTSGANDQMMGIQPSSASICAHNQSSFGSGTGCSLGWSGTGSNLSNARPVMRFKQTVPPSKIETVLSSTRTWNIQAGTTVPFFNASDTALIATISNSSVDLGCTNATLSGAGTGFTPSVFSTSTNRSRKEVKINPSMNGGSADYTATIYLTTTELNGVSPSTLFLVKTEEPTDATITPANSTLITPTLITGTNFTGFQGTFNVLANTRFFLTNGPLCTPPSTAVTPSGSTTFCAGGSVTLNAPTGTGYTYQWQNGGSNISGATSASYVATAAGDYAVLITSGGCSGTSTPVTVTVNTTNAGTITSSTSTVCSGQSIAFSDAAGGGVWSSNNTAIATVDASGNVYGVSGGNTTITYSVTNGCGTAIATKAVTVNTTPVVAAITGTASVCAGSTTVLSNTTTGGVWSSSNNAIATVSGGVTGGVAAGTANISYTVTSGGCSASSVAAVTVYSVPVATITPGGPLVFCPAGNVVLNAPAGTGLSYQWMEGGMPISGATNSSYTTNNGADYTVMVTNTSNCSRTSAITTTTVDPTAINTPAVAIAATPGLVLCSTPTTITFAATPTFGGATPSYTWYVNGSATATGSTLSYVPGTGDVVKCMMVSTDLCRAVDTASRTVTVSISPLLHPSVSINALPNDTACAGVMTTFAAIPVNGGTAPTYVWKKNGVNVATGPTYNYVPVNGDILICTMTSNYGCRDADTGVSAPMTVTVLAGIPNTVTVTADHSTIPVGGAVTFTATSTNGGTNPSYQWYVNGLPVAGATSAIYTTTGLMDGQIVTCSVLSSELCATPGTAYSAGFTIHVTNGVGTVGLVNDLVLIPNPNNGTFTIKGSLYVNADEVTVRVTNMLGQEVYITKAQVRNNSIDQSMSLPQSVAAGAYMVNVITTSGNQVFHMMVTK